MSTRYIRETNEGRVSREHVITWVTMATAAGAVIAQVAAKLLLGIDLGVDIDLALLTGFGSGAAYTAARMVVKTGVALAEGKVKAAAIRPKDAKAAIPPSPFAIPAAVSPPAVKLDPPTVIRDNNTRAW